MSALRRIPRALALALIAGGALASTASAAEIGVRAEIYGAGSISGPLGHPTAIPCEQLEPAANSTHKVCPTWTTGDNTNASQVTLYAQPRGGWQFASWEGCDTVVGTACTLTASSGPGLKKWMPKARFIDVIHPAPIPDFSIRPIDGEQGVFEGTWSDTEQHLSYRCSIDGGAATPCASGERFLLTEGRHDIAVHAVDPNGNEGVAKTLDVTVIDTHLTGPAERATVRSAAFTARSVLGDAFECALDGGAFAPCGQGTPGTDVPLALPALADGRHRLLVRARLAAARDRAPASRTFTIDTKDPVTPAPAPTPVPSPSPAPAAAVEGAVAPGIAVAPAQAIAPAKLRLTYRYRNGRFTRLATTGVPAGTKLAVTVKCPKGKKCVKRPATLKALVGKRLAPGTKITVRAGDQTRTLKIRRGRGPLAG